MLVLGYNAVLDITLINVYNIVILYSRVHQYKCSRCRSFASVKYMSVFQHINLVHSFEPNFSISCGIDDYKATFQKMPTWRRHRRKEHQRAKVVAAAVPGPVLQDQPTLYFDFDNKQEGC